MKKEILRLEHLITKGDMTNLADFNCQVYAGEIVGVVTITGYGKEQLIKVIENRKKLEYGYVYLEEKRINYNLKDEIEPQIYVIEYISKLINTLELAENIFEVKSGAFMRYISKTKIRNQLIQMFEEYDIYINPKKKIDDLTIYERCVIEVLKSIVLNKQLIVINDLSGCFDETEAEKFHMLLKKIVNTGKGILYLGVDLKDMEDLCDRVVLMKDGRDIKTYYFNEMTLKAQKEMIRNLYQNIRTIVNEEDSYSRITYSIYESTSGFNKVVHINEGKCVVVYPQKKKYLDIIKKVLFEENQNVNVEIVIGNQCYRNKQVQRMIGRELIYIDENNMENFLFYNMSYLENLSLWIEKKTTYSLGKIRKAVLKEIYPKVGAEIYTQDIHLLNQEGKINLIYYKIYLLRPIITIIVFPFANADFHIKELIISRIQELKEVGISIVIFDTNQTDVSYVADSGIVWT